MQTANPLLSSYDLSLAHGRVAKAVCVQSPPDLPEALQTLGLQVSRPVLVLVGGAGNLSPETYDRLQNLFTEAIAPLAAELQMTVIDGGTDTGVMRLMGTSRAKIGAHFPLIGVTPKSKAKIPGNSNADAQPLEPHHTHFVLIPGTHWGDESPWIAAVATAIAHGMPSVTLLLNGGEISRIDVQENMTVGRPVVVVAGSGRLADEIATAVRHPETEVRPALRPILETGRSLQTLEMCDLSEPTEQVKTVLKRRLLMQP